MSEPVITKRCSRCQEIRPLSDFYKDKGSPDLHGYWCKACVKLNVRLHLMTARGRALHHNRTKRYAASNQGRQQSRKRVAKYIAEHPLIRRANQIIHNAVRWGLIPHPEKLICRLCSNHAKQYHHPNGYDEDHILDIVPVCHKHHVLLHYYLERQ